MSELPDGWTQATIGELGNYINGRGFKRSEWEDEGLPIIRIQNLTGSSDHFNFFSGSVDERYRIRPGDLLVSWAATLDVFVWKGDSEGWLNQHIFKVESRIDSSFHFYLLKFILDALRRQTHGGGMVHITRGRFEATSAPLPPLPEQHRIVAKIEELFSELDVGVAALDRVQAKLERYRASVLMAAVEGQLTEQWREENPAEETGAELLERILVERRARWEGEQIARYEAKRKEPPKGWRAKYKEPVGPDSRELPELPEEWCWASVDQLSHRVQYGSSSKTTGDEPTWVPVLRMGNIQDGELDVRDLKFLPGTHSEFPDLLLARGDVLFNRTNSAELVGKTAVYHGHPDPCSFASYLLRVQLLDGCLPEFLCFCLNSFHGRRWARSVVSQQVGQANINGTKLRNFFLPLPPTSEQVRIVSQAGTQLLGLGRSHGQLGRAREQGDVLRMAILKRAFEGRLVPQDPNDEPASVLVERIRGTREAHTPRRKRLARKATTQPELDL